MASDCTWIGRLFRNGPLQSLSQNSHVSPSFLSQVLPISRLPPWQRTVAHSTLAAFVQWLPPEKERKHWKWATGTASIQSYLGSIFPSLFRKLKATRSFPLCLEITGRLERKFPDLHWQTRHELAKVSFLEVPKGPPHYRGKLVVSVKRKWSQTRMLSFGNNLMASGTMTEKRQHSTMRKTQVLILAMPPTN